MGGGALASEPRFWKCPLSCVHSGVCVRVSLCNQNHITMSLCVKVVLVSVIVSVECIPLLRNIVSETNGSCDESRDRGVACI